MTLQLQKAGFIFLLLITFLIASLTVTRECRGELWTSPDGRFSAEFPRTPTENTSEITDGAISEWEVVNITGASHVSYSIIIANTKYQPSELIRYDMRKMIARSHSKLIKISGADKSPHRVENVTFMDGIERLNYQLEIIVNNEKYMDIGFWFMAGNQIIATDATYPIRENNDQKIAAENFLNSFKVNKKIEIPETLESYVQKVAASASLQPGKCSSILVKAMESGLAMKGGKSVGAWCFFSDDDLEKVKMRVDKAQKKVGPQFWRGEWRPRLGKGYRLAEKVGVFGRGLAWFVSPASDSKETAPPHAKTLVIAHGMDTGDE